MKTYRPLKAKTNLKQKSPLKAKESLKVKTKLSKQPKTPIGKLKKDVRAVFNRMVKYRDSEWDGVHRRWIFDCITCGKPVLFKYYDDDGKPRFLITAHAGHFMPETRHSTRYNELNVNGQCGSCNFNQGEQYAYAKALDLKYGDGTAEELVHLSKELHKYKIPELLEIKADAEEQIKFYERQETN